ncbi:hypothetical protein H6CHR_01736 [Variovorax sp. PBL-H6]|uniref:hypothetical protein n=1 Tax=Variovorax sp. PBL-H6 TaxID=434009 RepID=UPI001318133F|nr:hypothetical protein [Variovorax sp. PBL-H6]VTU22172.1 hypothetical protein H6CHR_01736 [Variovorax sp. PBL-H6]
MRPIRINSPTGSHTVEERKGPNAGQVEHDTPEPPATPCVHPSEGPSIVALRIAAFRDQLPDLAANQATWTTHLLNVLQGVETVQEVHDWLDALSPAHCVGCPDLLSGLSERLCDLLPHFAPEEIHRCVTRLLDMASAAGQSGSVWADLCAGIQLLQLAAVQRLLVCLRDQRIRGQLPGNGALLIRHVVSIELGMRKKLPTLGFGDAGIRAAPVDAPDRTILSRDALMLVMAHLLKNVGIDWTRPEVFGPKQKDQDFLRDLSWASTRFGPMLANYPWMKTEATFRLALQFVEDPGELDAVIKSLIHELVDVPAQRVASMLPCAPGVARRRLDLMLRALMLALPRVVPGREDEWLKGAYLVLHDLAVLQSASQRQAMSPCFAQHVDLSVLPLHMLAMADRMFGFGDASLAELAFVVLTRLAAYPKDVQVTTLISVLSLLPDEVTSARALTHLKKLMQGSNSQTGAVLPAWMLYQWHHVDSMLSLLENPGTDLTGNAASVPDGLLAGLQQHHGVGDHPPLFIDDPFRESHVLWTIADVRLLGALCERSALSDGWKRQPLVDCLVDMLRQFCSVSAMTYEFVASSFMSAFPADILRSAFIRLTAYEQGLILVRVYTSHPLSEWSDHTQLIEMFAKNESIDQAHRKRVLVLIRAISAQHPEVKKFAHALVRQLPRRDVRPRSRSAPG